MSTKQISHLKWKEKTASDKLFEILVILIAVLAFVTVAYPLYFIIIASFSDSTMVNMGKVLLLPKKISFYGYEQIFSDSRIWRGYLNTIIYSVGGTIVNMLVTLPAAYTLSRINFKPRKVIMPLFVFTMYFSGGMIPTYLMVKTLHLIDTPWAMILPTAMSVYNLIIARTFMETSIPEDLYEAARLDGCNHFRYFATIVLPLSKAVISVLFLYYMVAHWNDFFTGLLYLNKDNLQPLQMVLRNILLSNQAFQGGGGSVAGAGSYAQQYADQIKFGVIIVSTIPILCIYPFIQKYFEKGVMIGAVKG